MSQNEVMTGEPVLCFELLQRIIQETASDPASIQACSLASKSFVKLAQEILFRNITIHSFGSAKKSGRTRVAEFFDQAPHLGKYVRHVKYELALRFTKEASDSGWPKLPEDGHSISLSEYFPNIQSLSIAHWQCASGVLSASSCTGCDLASQLLTEFSMSQTLNTVAIEGAGQLAGDAVFGLQGPSLRTLSLRLCRLSPLAQGSKVQADSKDTFFPYKYLIVDCVTVFPIHRLDKANELVHLRVSGYNTVSRPSSPPVFDQLKTATVTNAEFLAALCPTICLDEAGGDKAFPALSHLKIKGVGFKTTVAAIETILQNVQVLEKLSISLDFKEAEWKHCNIAPALEASHRTLREVYLGTCVLENNEFGLVDTIKLLTDALATVQGDNVIEVLNIKCGVLGAQDLGDKKKAPDFDSGWERFDSLLLDNRATQFPHLRKVKLHLTLVKRFDRNEEDDISMEESKFFQDLLKDPLKRLYSTSDIDFECQIVSTGDSNDIFKFSF